jgi:hypothetical protein
MTWPGLPCKCAACELKRRETARKTEETIKEMEDPKSDFNRRIKKIIRMARKRLKIER